MKEWLHACEGIARSNSVLIGDALHLVNLQGTVFLSGSPEDSSGDTLGHAQLSALWRLSRATYPWACCSVGRTRLDERRRSLLKMPSRWSQTAIEGLQGRTWGRKCKFGAHRTPGHYDSVNWSRGSLGTVLLGPWLHLFSVHRVAWAPLQRPFCYLHGDSCHRA